ncbi:MAG: hypothetical protein IJG84_10750 [Kiritimatiellae bacterium]|nr:hypothetical protein [Kiritimatiellia bacterium]
MKNLCTLLIVFCASAALATDVRPTLPPVEFLDTEVVTNVAISASARSGREFAFELEFTGSESNNVEIAFGTDADGDGALSADETSLSAGWDCGEWFVLNEATGERFSEASAGGAHELAGCVRLRTDGRMRVASFYDGATALFPSLAAKVNAWAFPVEWNMVRLVGRGETVRAGESFHVTATAAGFAIRLQ